MSNYFYLIPLFPLLGFIINGLFWKRMPHTISGALATVMVILSFLLSLSVYFSLQNDGSPIEALLFPFIQTDKFNIPFSFYADTLTATFLLIITGIGSLIHLYSTGYMKGDEGYTRYFAYLNLFVFAMLILVMGANYVMMFIGWEGVGLASYLLIGFWFKKREYTNAAKKAFIMNRIGDLGFLTGMLLTLFHFGSLQYNELWPQLVNVNVGENIYNLIGICFFIGAMGKSAQIPLYTWLPDAMAGPTPVSALIHAATMVTAGIYMIARSSALYNLAPIAQNLVAIVGLATAFFAATIAMKQYDIKKVLAYSTVSQLGYMFLALGVGSYVGGVFHVMTHAFFKALLFLAAGSVIHGMSGEQDLRLMGGLRKKMPITHITFLIGCLAIAGIPGLSGFFSKDEILASAFAKHPAYWAIALITAMMTAFYMFRLYFYVFSGGFRGTDHQLHHLHESPYSMTIPLIILAVFSVIAGYVGLPPVISEHHWLATWLAPSVQNHEVHHLSHTTEWILMGASVILVIIAVIIAKSRTNNVSFPANTGLAKSMENKWYVDEAYENIFVKPIHQLSLFFNNALENKVIDGGVNSVGRMVDNLSVRFKNFQNGIIGNYLMAYVIGVIILLFIALLPIIRS